MDRLGDILSIIRMFTAVSNPCNKIVFIFIPPSVPRWASSIWSGPRGVGVEWPPLSGRYDWRLIEIELRVCVAMGTGCARSKGNWVSGGLPVIGRIAGLERFDLVALQVRPGGTLTGVEKRKVLVCPLHIVK